MCAPCPSLHPTRRSAALSFVRQTNEAADLGGLRRPAARQQQPRRCNDRVGASDAVHHSELQQWLEAVGDGGGGRWTTVLQREQVNSDALVAAWRRFDGRGPMRLALSDQGRCGYPQVGISSAEHRTLCTMRLAVEHFLHLSHMVAVVGTA